jgi:hypothetical protein
MKRTLPVCFVAVCLLVLAGFPARAIDRDASMIDSIGVLGSSQEGSESLSVVLQGESAVPESGGLVALVVGGQYGGVNPHELEVGNYWSAFGGLKWYLFPVTALSFLGEYGTYDVPGESGDVLTGTVELRQRLVPADKALSPYLLGAAAVRSADAIATYDNGKLFEFDKVSSELVLTAGGGLDVSMTPDMVLNVQAVYTESEELFDGWVARVLMTYYWE